MKRFGLLILSVFLFVSGTALFSEPARDVSAPAKVHELVLLHTNDHHGTVLPHNGLGGLAERAAYIRGIRALNPNVLLLDAGDLNTGTALSNMFSAEPDILAYNMMGYDVLEAADLLSDKIFHCHFKDTPRGGHGCKPIGDSNTPCASLLMKLKMMGYKHMVSVEYECPTDPTPGLNKSLGFIRGVFAAIGGFN